MRKVTALFLALALCLSLCTVTAFADGTKYAITNGTPESAKETNHGYITIGMTSAAEGETVTITVHPADGYRLNSLTATPGAETMTFKELMAGQSSIFLIGEENAWKNGKFNGSTESKMYLRKDIGSDDIRLKVIGSGYPLTDAMLSDSVVTKVDGGWKYVSEGDDTPCIVIFNMDDNNLVSINYTATASGLSSAVTSLINGDYAPAASTEYTVTFDLNGITGTEPDAQTIEKDGKVTKPDDPTDTVHTFAGWYKTKDATTGALSDPWDFDNDTVTANMTLYAQWTRPLGEILATYPDPGFPSSDSGTAPEKVWVNGVNKGFIGNKNTKYEALFLKEDTEAGCGCLTTNMFTKIGDNYVFEYIVSAENLGTFTLYMEDGVISSIHYSYGTGGTRDFDRYNGTYAPATTIADILPNSFPGNYTDGWKREGENNCSLYVNEGKLVAQYPYEDEKGPALINLDMDSELTPEDNNYSFTNDGIKWTFIMSSDVLGSVTISGVPTNNNVLNGTYSKSECIAAGTMISMPGGKQKAVEELEIGDVICTFDHETGEVSSAPIAFIWENKNVGNAFTLTFEDDIEVTVIEAHGFYDQEEQKYVFINLQNAEEYIGHRFYNADTNSWLALKSCEALNNSVDAYEIITSGDLNHMSNGMLSVSDDKTIKILANLFEYDDQMKFDADKKNADIEKYGLTSKEKILELEGFTATDYDAYNLQYVNVMIGKGLITWEDMEALSDYCVENGWVDIYSGSETAEKNEAPKMLLMSATAPKTLLGSTPEPTPQDGIEINPNENGTYTFIMPGYAVTVTAVFEKVGGGNHHHGGSTTPAVTSATTADMGVALYGVLSVSSMIGMGWVSKKRK